MNFFDGIAGNVPLDEASRNVWLFFVVALPTSVVVLFTFFFWDKWERNKDEQEVERLRIKQVEMARQQDNLHGLL